MAFHLGEIEVRSGPSRDKLLCVVEEEQAEVDEARGGGFAVDADMPFGEMPSARPDEQRRELAVQPVCLAFRARVRDGAPCGMAEGDLGLHPVSPRRGGRVLEIGPE